MNRKPAKGKQKIDGVTKAERSEQDSSQRLVIHSRPIIGSSTAADEETEGGDMSSAAPQTLTAPLLATVKRTSITVNPASAQTSDTDTEKEKPAPAEKKDEGEKDEQKEKEVPAEEASAESEDVTEPDETVGKKEATAEPGTTDASPKTEQAPDDIKTTEAIPSAGSTDGAVAGQPQQDMQVTADAVRREREMQEYIKNRQYFVPINAVARKRSIHVSLGLTLMVLILAFVLLDLMLDTGMIYLVQKIPHTHFFNTFSNM